MPARQRCVFLLRVLLSASIVIPKYVNKSGGPWQPLSGKSGVPRLKEGVSVSPQVMRVFHGRLTARKVLENTEQRGNAAQKATS